MGLIDGARQKVARVDVQVSVITCLLVIISCIIMFAVTFSIMRSILRDVYGTGTDLVADTIVSHLDEGLFSSEADEADVSKAANYLAAMRENTSTADVVVYRFESGGFECIIDVEKTILRESVEPQPGEEMMRELVNISEGTYYGTGDFYKTNGHFRFMKLYPIYNNKKHAIGAVGIALEAKDLYTAEQILRVLFYVIIILSCIISIMFARKIFKRISNPLYQDSSNTDALTGFKSKNAFSIDLHNIESSKADKYSVISADMNGLKMINDTQGHQAGDMYLERAAAVIRKATEGEGAACYRVGGDEFVIIMKDKTDEELEKIAACIDEMTEEDNKGKSGVKLSLSVGFARFDSSQDKNFAMTIERSDKIMYENKRQYYLKKNMTPR